MFEPRRIYNLDVYGGCAIVGPRAACDVKILRTDEAGDGDEILDVSIRSRTRLPAQLIASIERAR